MMKMRILSIFVATILLAQPAAQAEMIRLDSSGGTKARGGRVKLDGTAWNAMQAEQTRWTFRALEDRAIEFPDYFSSVARDKQKRFEASVNEGEKVNPRTLKDGSDLHDWYKAFTERLVNDYTPKVRGAIGANVRIKPGGVDLIAFYGYKYQIAFERAASKPKPSEQPGSNEAELKASVTSALKEVSSMRELLLPPGVESVELKIILGGDPEGAGGTWTNLSLIDDLNGNIMVPK
jgi:hypothetical protein